MLAQDYLEALGYHVLVARTGVAGLALARSEHPDLILLDVQMPDLNGIETARRMRDDALLQHTPIIALTALTMPGERERCLAAGMNAYLEKPVSLKTLAQVVRQHLVESSHA
jgi:CheY-like chemotaxis protein